MKVFHCDHCQHLVFFESSNCVSCGRALAFLPDILEVATLEPQRSNEWESLAPASSGRHYRLCANYEQHSVCNWAVPANDPNPLCVSCRLTTTIPDLSVPENLPLWRKLEAAKRRVVYSLLSLKLPIVDRHQDPAKGLAFEFLADDPNRTDPVLTGHEDGKITINLIEADDAIREKRRTELHEPYRTLLGHFRHEIGHYYWDRLIDNTPRLQDYRAQFGDERIDYGEALKKHYENGPAGDWQATFISAYAASHPWEDWAETWAHYLHMIDTLETASACGLAILPVRRDEPSMRILPDDTEVQTLPLDQMILDWHAVTYALNNFSRGLGQLDSYPFVRSEPANEKMRFIYQTVLDVAAAASPPNVEQPNLPVQSGMVTSVPPIDPSAQNLTVAGVANGTG